MKHKKKKLNSIDYECNYAIIAAVGELHQKYIQLFIDLKTHKSIVDADFYIAAQKTLTQQYLDELELLRVQARRETEAKFYMAESLSDVLKISSRRSRVHWYSLWGCWKNSPMKAVLDERVEREAQGLLNALIEGIEPKEDELVQAQDEKPVESDKVSEEVEQADISETVEDTDEQEVPTVPYDPDAEEESEFEDDEDYEIKDGELDELDDIEDEEVNREEESDKMSDKSADEEPKLQKLAAAQQTIAGITFVPMSESEPQSAADDEFTAVEADEKKNE